MTAIEDPGRGSAAAGPDRPGNDLEDWLSDLRTDVAADPSGWIGDESADGQPAREPAEERGMPERGGGGRHRAAD